MSDTTEAVKKYWPWVAGGVVGLVLIMKMRGGGAGVDPLASYYVAQQQGAAAQQAAAAQAKAVDNSYALGMAQIQGQIQANQLQMTALMGQIDAQKAVAMADIGRQGQTEQLLAAGNTQVGMVNAQANYTLAQGQAGLAAATGAAQLVAQLQAPAVAGIQAAALQNVSAMQTAGQISTAGFGATANMLQSTGGAAVGLGNALANTNAAQSVGLASMAGSLSNQLSSAMKPTPPNQNNGTNAMWGTIGDLGSKVIGGLFM